MTQQTGMKPQSGLISTQGSARVRGYLFICILAQPILDILAFLLSAYGMELFITVLRGVVLFLGIILVIQNKAFKKSDLVYAALLVIYGVAGFAIKASGMPSLNKARELISFIKLFSLPVTLISFMRLIALDRPAHTATVRKALFFSGWLIAFSVLLSLLTGTHVHTYDQPWAQIGLNGWFSSGNQQSLVLMAVLPFLIMESIERKPWVLLVAIAASWILLNLNGTRVAYLSWLAMAALLILLLLPIIFKSSIISRYTLAVVLLALGLVLSFVVKNRLPISILESGRDFRTAAMESRMQEIQAQETQPAGNLGLGEAIVGNPGFELESPDVLEATAGASFHGIAPYNQIKWNDLTGREKMLFDRSFSNPDHSHADVVTAIEYSAVIASSKVSQRTNERYRERVFTATAFSNAQLVDQLFGIPHQKIAGFIGDVETDYMYVFTSFGILGSLLLFLAMLLEVLRALRLVGWPKWHWLSDRFLMVPAFITAMLLGAAFFAGRSFQQPAVSIYLALCAALVLNRLVQLGQEGKMH